MCYFVYFTSNKYNVSLEAHKWNTMQIGNIAHMLDMRYGVNANTEIVWEIYTKYSLFLRVELFSWQSFAENNWLIS